MELHNRRRATPRPVYTKTRDALAAYFDAPTPANAELVRVTFWLEAPTRDRVRPTPTSVDEIWDLVRRRS